MTDTCWATSLLQEDRPSRCSLTDERGVRMPNFAQFVTFRDDPFTLMALTGPRQLLIETEIPALTGLDPERDAVLAFNVTGGGVVGLTMEFNGHQILEVDFNPPHSDPAPRGLHETFTGRFLNKPEQGSNKLVVAAEFFGRVTLSDFVLTYHASG
jgi:hypothetical protein